MLETWREFNYNLSCLVCSKPTAVVLDVEFILKSSTITGHSNYIVNVNLGRIRELDSFPFRKFVRNSSKVNDVFRESEGWSDNVAFEGQC